MHVGDSLKYYVLGRALRQALGAAHMGRPAPILLPCLRLAETVKNRPAIPAV